MPDTTEEIANLTPEQRLFMLGEDELDPNLLGMHNVHVDAGELWLLYCDGELIRQLKPGRHSWWNGFLRKWRVQKINARVELLHIPVKGRVKGPSMTKEMVGGSAMELACDVTAELEIPCRITDIDTFLRYRDPLSVFLASIQNMVVEFIGQLSYDQYGKWATVIRDLTRDRLQVGGRDDAERRVGMRVEDVFITDFKPSTAQDRNVLSMYQLIERGKRELVEAQVNAQRDTVVAESFANQGAILNIAPSILALQDSPIGKALIDRDADLRQLMVASGLNPGINIQPIQETTGQLGSGQAPAMGYLNPPSLPAAKQIPANSSPPMQVTGQIFPVDTTNPAKASLPTLSQGSNGPPVEEDRQRLELSGLASAGFMVAGKGQIVPEYDATGQPIAGSQEWVLQVYVTRPNGHLEMVFHCPTGYPAIAPKAEVKSPGSGGRQWSEPNALHRWNPGLTLVDVAREIANDTP